MDLSLAALAEQVRAHRIERQLSQERLAAQLGEPHNRSMVAHLEQAVRLPAPDAIELIGKALQIPKAIWEPYTNPATHRRIEFEQVLSDLVGRPLSLYAHSEVAVSSAESQISALLGGKFSSDKHCFDALNSILTFYSSRWLSREFFQHYLGARSFVSLAALQKSVSRFQVDALRLFPTFEAAFERMNRADDLEQLLEPLEMKPDEHYRERSQWDPIRTLPEEDLRFLGYVAGSTIERETEERTFVFEALTEIADRKEKGLEPLAEVSAKKQSRLVGLLAKYHSGLKADQLSPMFLPEVYELRQFAAAVAPPKPDLAARISSAQRIAETNLAHYLSADHLDVYIATSMRSHADFVSVNRFTAKLFAHEVVAPLHLRFFNPTQSWILDRIAKGLVEALMLRRSSLTIYMAQKSDSFGKDSEASVALGQGKPVLVYVPKLSVPKLGLDSAALGRLSDSDLVEAASRWIPSFDVADYRNVDGGLDRSVIVNGVVRAQLERAGPEVIVAAARDHWADFDLHGEAASVDVTLRDEYREWLDSSIKTGTWSPPRKEVLSELVRVLWSRTGEFERRATVFKEVHPLALQVILSTGVLNGILVVRSFDECARTMAQLLRNELDLVVESDEHNCRLVERVTGSTIRVISRHRLIRNAFTKYFHEGNEESMTVKVSIPQGGD